jgi:hypothetical protein
MKHDTHLRQEIRNSFDDARIRVRAFTGLYTDEDLAEEVLSICDDVLVRIGTSPRLDELRQEVGVRCQRLADVTNRFSSRDPAVIAAARMQVIASIDQMQDAALERMVATSSQAPHAVLRRRSP